MKRSAHSAPRARASTGQPKEAEMTSPTSPTPAAGSPSTETSPKKTPVWLAVVIVVIVVVFFVVVGVVVWAVNGSNPTTPTSTSSPTMTVRYSQDLVPGGAGTIVKDGRLQCADDSTTLSLKKEDKVNSPKGDVVVADWTDTSVIIKITGTPIKDRYRAVIFEGKHTVVAEVASQNADATNVTLTANFAKEFKDSAPAESARLCIAK